MEIPSDLVDCELDAEIQPEFVSTPFPHVQSDSLSMHSSNSESTSDIDEDHESASIRLYNSHDTSPSASSKSPSDIALDINQLPVMPLRIKFPVTNFGFKKHSFNSAWYKKYSWIEYSQEKDAAFWLSLPPFFCW